MGLDDLRKEFLNFCLTNEDKQFLNYIKDRYKFQTTAYVLKNPKNQKNTFKSYQSFFISQSDRNYIHEPIFKKIADLCKKTKLHHDVQYVYKRAHLGYIPGSLPYHLDQRQCVLSFPIGDLTYPISWVNEDGQYLANHYYNAPVLINTKVKHGCIENDQDRFLFQVGFDESFCEIKNLLD